MSRLIPFFHEALKLLLKRFQRGKIRCRQTFPLKNGKPLLDLIHPRAMNGREMKFKTRVLAEPLLHLFSGMHPGVIADDMNPRNTGWIARFKQFKQFNEFGLALASPANAPDFSRAGVKGSQEIQSPFPLVFMLQTDWTPFLGWLGFSLSRARLQGGFLVEAQDDFVSW